MKTAWTFVLPLILCSGCQPVSVPIERSEPDRTAKQDVDATAVLMVGVGKDGGLKQQVVHAYKTKELKEHLLVVRAGATLTILESTDGVSRVHFMTNAWTPDYKATIPQSGAIGWIATDEIVRIEKKQDNAQLKDRSTANVSDMNEAVSLGIAAMIEQSHYPKQEYTLISAQQIFHKGKYIWRITFKPTDLLPKDPSEQPIGLGGEIFVNVDLNTKQAEVRYGE